MVASPFAFLRGAAAVIAADLAATPVSGLAAVLCGDAHLANFGLFASPERRLVFDINDFDEAYPGPWEWDLKRLAAGGLRLPRSTRTVWAILDRFRPLVDQVVDQATRRVLRGERVPAAEKAPSLFEPHTALIRRGKARRPRSGARSSSPRHASRSSRSMLGSLAAQWERATDGGWQGNHTAIRTAPAPDAPRADCGLQWGWPVARA
jgi:hypothetical protein